MSSAAALLSYDVPHHAPWGWRVSLYTWTKFVAAGAFAVPAALAFAGVLPWANAAARWAAPLLALAFLALTGGLLVADLKHPERFRRSSPGVTGAAGWCAGRSSWAGSAASWPSTCWRRWPGDRGPAGAGRARAAAGLAAAVYTAYLFAQAKARDLWQSPLLPPHLAVQAALAGAAAMLPLLAWLAPGRAVTADEVVLAAAAAAHLLLVAGEITLPHVTAHARLAAHELSRGRYRRPFGLSVVFIAVAVAAPWIGTWAVPFALAGLLAYEHAYVQAGQSVPLA